MSEKTGIAWCDSTGNPWIGCTKVSPGCKNCYAAELDANRFSRTMGGGTAKKPISHWGKDAPRVRTKAFWKDALRWNAEAGAYHYEFSAFGWRPHKPRIFPSLCDWLDDEVPIEWLADFLKLIHDTPNLDWLLLTKRPENFKERLHQVNLSQPESGFDEALVELVSRWIDGHALSNVWLGVSVENQAMADLRIPQLLQIPARVRFLSVEPLLERVSLFEYFHEGPNMSVATRLNWVIVGGESGANRRDCGVQAIVDVANQCVKAKVPCFVKQASAFNPGQRGEIPAETWALKQFPL